MRDNHAEIAGNIVKEKSVTKESAAVLDQAIKTVKGQLA
jgi:hypothetical protein